MTKRDFIVTVKGLEHLDDHELRAYIEVAVRAWGHGSQPPHADFGDGTVGDPLGSPEWQIADSKPQVKRWTL